VGHGLRMEATRLNFSIPAPLNPAHKPLFLLPWDLEAEPPAGAAESGSIAGKSSYDSDLAYLLAIICLRGQSGRRLRDCLEDETEDAELLLLPLAGPRCRLWD
jgi:hypothetical protein